MTRSGNNRRNQQALKHKKNREVEQVNRERKRMECAEENRDYRERIARAVIMCPVKVDMKEDIALASMIGLY
jgi:hypothetical protein